MRIYTLLFLLFFSVSACEQPSIVDKEMYGDADGEFEEMLEIPSTHQPAPPEEPAESDQITKKVIKTGSIDFETEDVAQTYQVIRHLLPKYKAHIESENQTNTVHRITYNVTVRVPSNVYDSLYNSLTRVASRVDNRHSRIEDVTERYYDLRTRIKNKKILEQRYLALLDKATEVKDILEIENNLNQVRIEIEGLEGQFNYLSKQVRFSTINLTFYEVLPYTFDPSQREGFGARFLSALDSGWQGFLSFLVGLTTLWPFIILIVGAVILFRKLRGVWKRKK